MEIAITLTGNKQMLLHNGRLANPIDPYTQAIKKVTDNRTYLKTEEGFAEKIMREARGGVYETHDGKLGLPVDNVWKSIQEAATAFKQGTNVKRAFLMLSDIEPLMIDGKTVDDIDSWLLEAGHVDVRMIRNNGTTRVARGRAILEPGWTVTHRFELLDDVLELRTLEPIFARAGRLHGVGDYRPRFGTYTTEVEVVE